MIRFIIKWQQQSVIYVNFIYCKSYPWLGTICSENLIKMLISLFVICYIYVAVLPSSMEETTPISKSKDRNYGKWKYNAININTALVRINHQSIRTVTQENTRPSYGPRWLIGLLTNASFIGIRIEVPTLYMELYNKNIYLGFILILHYTPVIVIDDEVSMTTFWTKFPTPTIVCQAVASCC